MSQTEKSRTPPPGNPKNGRSSYSFNVPRWSLKNPTMVILGTLVFVVWGLVNYFTMSRRESPEIKIATALVITLYPGASAEKVEEQVTRKLEDAIESMDNIRSFSSTTRQNISQIAVELEYDSDFDMEWQKLRSKVAEVKPELPKEIVGPDVWDNFGDTTGMIITLSGKNHGVLGDLADELRGDVKGIRSVGDVSIYGKRPEVVYLEGTRSGMTHHGITPHKLAQALEMSNLRIPGGTIQTDRYQFRIEPTGAFHSVKDIENTIINVSSETGHPLHVRDLFQVQRTIKTPPDIIVQKNGRTALAVGIVMKSGFNIVQMGRDLKNTIDDFRSRIPSDVSMDVVHNSPRQVNDQINNFMVTLLEGLCLVVLVMALFVGIRSASISFVVIPLSVLIGLSAMPLLNIDLEAVSIGAFIVSLGMLVDDSIIVVDAVDIKLREGFSPHEAAWRGTRELSVPVISGTLATVVAFLPMLLLTTEVGAYVRSLPLVVSVALLGSLLLSQTLTPLMAKKMLTKPKKAAPPLEKSPVSKRYRSLMTKCLSHPWLIVFIALLSLVGAGGVLKVCGFSFFPDAERDQFTVDIWLKEGSSIKETERLAGLADAELRKDPEVANTLLYIGRGGPRFYITVKPEFQQTNYAHIMVNTVNPDVTHRVIDRFNQKAQTNFPGARVFARKIIMGRPFEAPISFCIIGPDFNMLRRISHQVQDILRAIPGAEHVRDNQGPDISSLKVNIQGERASRVGVSNTDVALSFLAAYQGFELTRFNDGDDEIPVVLRLKDDERRIDDDLTNLPIASNLTGSKVPLSSIATLEPVWGPGVIKRNDNRRTLTVLAWNQGRLADNIIEEALPKISQIDLAPGYKIEAVGEKEEMDRAFKELLIIFGVILASLVGILVLQFGTLKSAIIVLLAIPFSIVGASLGLYFGGYSFSFMAFVGLVSLAGIAIKDSVVLVDCIERTRLTGLSIKESVIKAGIYRLRPIVLTTVTTIGGLLPLGLFGGVLLEPMAWTMIGGLSLATVLTLVMIPVFYLLLARNDPKTPTA